MLKMREAVELGCVECEKRFTKSNVQVQVQLRFGFE